MKNLKFLAAVFAAVALIAGCRRESKGLPRGEASESLKSGVEAFVARAEADSAWELHSLMVLQHGKVLSEGWHNGASAEEPHVMWSVSKTFTATAVGFAIAEGRLSLDDRVVSFFPEELPDTVGENLAAATVESLLTMTVGMTEEPGRDLPEGTSWTKAFLAAPVEHEPGTYFIYNSFGTYMLSAIVQKVTGEKVNDYLTPRLWEPLGIEKPQWDESPQGINCGGWGLHLRTEDMARFGQTLLDGGKYAGRQVIPADWVEKMTSYKVPCQPNGTRPEQVGESGVAETMPDWVQGYCYQMWRGRHDSVRADGAFGQYIIILREQDAVVVITEQTYGLQEAVSSVWEFLLPALEEGK